MNYLRYDLANDDRAAVSPIDGLALSDLSEYFVNAQWVERRWFGKKTNIDTTRKINQGQTRNNHFHIWHQGYFCMLKTFHTFDVFDIAFVNICWYWWLLVDIVSSWLILIDLSWSWLILVGLHCPGHPHDLACCHLVEQTLPGTGDDKCEELNDSIRPHRVVTYTWCNYSPLDNFLMAADWSGNGKGNLSKIYLTHTLQI